MVGWYRVWGVALALCATGVMGTGVRAQTVALSPVRVVAGDVSPTWGAAQHDTTGHTLLAVPDLLVISQGGHGAQNDLSIRGSSFSGAGISVAGLALRNPQTEHFHADLPVPTALFRAPEVLTGLEQARDGDGHLVGTAALEFAPVSGQGDFSLGVGERGREWQRALIRHVVPGEGGAVQAASVFGGRETAEALDYRDNDLDLWRAGAQAQWRSADGQADVVFGRQEKTFGARGYYGVSDSLPAEEEVEDTLLLGTVRWEFGGERYMRLSAGWRQIVDTYRILPDIYFNHTDSKALTAGLDGAVGIPGDGELVWRMGGEDERMDGLTLGDQKRRRGTLSLLPKWQLGVLAVSLGGRLEVFTDDAPAVLPQVGIESQVGEVCSLYASYTETVRQPSYTELNYESPGSLGNAGLERQEAGTVEAGLRGLSGRKMDWHVAIFYRETENTVDWVRETMASPRFTAVNLDRVDTLGVEAQAGWSVTEDLGLLVSYLWLDKDHEEAVYAGRYELDYAEHLARAMAVWRFCDAASLVGTHTLRWQVDNPLRSSEDFGVDGRLALQARSDLLCGATVSISVDNLWDDDFQPLAGQRVAGRRVSASIGRAW